MKNKAGYWGLLGLVLFLTIWEGSVRLGWADPFFVSSPSKTLSALFELFSSGTIYPHIWTSAKEFFWGLLTAIIAGVVLGFLIGSSKFLYELTRPFITTLYTTPRIILMPLIIIWVGIGIFSKVLVVFLGAVFPILINSISATRGVDPNLLLMAKSFNTSRGRIFTKIILPSSLPFIAAGIELAIGRALIGIVVGELYGARSGLGYLASYYGNTFQINNLMAVILIFIVFGVALTQLVHLLLVKLSHQQQNGA